MEDHRGDKIYPLDIYERVANRQKLIGADKSTFIISLFLMVNFFLFMILHRVLVIVMGLSMFVLILVQLAIFVFFGILIFRYVIFDEEAKMREYSDKNSDSFARFMHLRKDSTHEIQVSRNAYVHAFEYDNGQATCTIRFKFGSNENFKANETKQCLQEVFKVLTDNNFTFRTVSDAENFKKSREFDNYIANVNATKYKDLKPHILAMSDEILRVSLQECNVDQLYLSFQTASSYQLEDLEAVIKHLLKIFRGHVTCFRQITFLDLNQTIDFYREFYGVEAIDLAMMKAIELSEGIDSNFSEIVKVISLKSEDNKIFKTDINTDSILVTGERKITKMYEEVQNDDSAE